MSRDIKFRAFGGDEVWFGLFGYDIDGDWKFTTKDGWDCAVNFDTVGQYAGLKDKNGIEIYEGDIASCHDEFKYQCIMDDRGCFVFCNPDDKHDFYFLDDMDWEVIGNIHQNPELLQ